MTMTTTQGWTIPFQHQRRVLPDAIPVAPTLDPACAWCCPTGDGCCTFHIAWQLDRLQASRRQRGALQKESQRS